MNAFAITILLILLGLFTLMFIGAAFYTHDREQDHNAWKKPRPLPFEPDAAMRAAAISVRVPTQRLLLDDMDTAGAP